MNIGKLANLSYETLEKRFKKITTNKYHNAKGISEIRVMPKRSSRIEEDIYTFENDTLIVRDIALRTRDGGYKHIFTNFYENGITTTIKEINDKLQKKIKTTYDKTIVPLSFILDKRKNNTLKNIVGKLQGAQIDKNIPVTIIKKETKVAGQPASTEYNILVKGKKQRIRMQGYNGQVYVYTKNGGEEQAYDFGQFGDLKKSSTLNAIFNWFIKENNGLQ